MKIKKWSIFRANLDPVIGSEQGKTRPVLIISNTEINELLNTINVFPLTSKKDERQIYPNETLIPAVKFGLEKETIVLTHQIRTIDKRRLSHYYGEIDDLILQNQITEALFFQLAIDNSIV